MDTYGRRFRVLLVEDDALMARSVIRLLSPRCDVVGVSSIERAARLLDQESWSAVLADHNLGASATLHGAELLAVAALFAPDARRVLYSAAPPSLPPEVGIYVDAFVLKPFDPAALIAAIGVP